MQNVPVPALPEVVERSLAPLAPAPAANLQTAGLPSSGRAASRPSGGVAAAHGSAGLQRVARRNEELPDWSTSGAEIGRFYEGKGSTPPSLRDPIDLQRFHGLNF